MNELWTTLAARASVPLSDDQHAQLSRYLDLLIAGNERMNLTRITDRAAAELQHVADALTLLPHLPAPAAGAAPRFADIGSGGGVPGIPLAIARPDASLTLVESTKKKAVFLKETAAALNLTNVTVLDARAEDLGLDPAHREKYDVVIARAVATISWLAEWCLPLAKKGGKVLLMKGPKHAEELPPAAHAIQLVGGGVPTVHPVTALPGSDHLVIVEIPKVRLADRRYPRTPTNAKGNPIR